MGIAERKEREKLQRRKDILDAAEKVFFERGMGSATMDEVAEEAELSKGTLYLYFKSKEELYLGIAVRALELLLNMFKNAVKQKKTGIEKIKAIGEAYYRYSQIYPNYFNMIIHYETLQLGEMSEDSLAMECHQMGHKVQQVVAGAIQAGVEDGTIRRELDPIKTAFLLQGQSTGVIQLIAREAEHIRQFENFAPEELMERFMEFMFYALKAPEL